MISTSSLPSASLDALRQRFGRLNRAGRAVDARAMIVIKDKDAKADDLLDDEKPCDPIYGNAAARTWNWLLAHATGIAVPEEQVDGDIAGKKTKVRSEALAQAPVVDLGIDAFDRILGEDGQIPETLLAPSAALDAPVMFPAYIDFWCQTSPSPVPDPDIALFIHGRQRGEPDVQVCWRADLIGEEPVDRGRWCDVVALLPPTTAECMSIPISRMRRWIAQDAEPAIEDGDLLGVTRQLEADPDGRDRGRQQQAKRFGVLWRGAKKSILLEFAGRPPPRRHSRTAGVPCWGLERTWSHSGADA